MRLRLAPLAYGYWPRPRGRILDSPLAVHTARPQPATGGATETRQTLLSPVVEVVTGWLE